jgi:hypothetical protein
MTITQIRMIEFRNAGRNNDDVGIIEFRNVRKHNENDIKLYCVTFGLQYPLHKPDTVSYDKMEQYTRDVYARMNDCRNEIEESIGRINNWKECTEKVQKRLIEYYQKIIAINAPLSYEYH